MENRYRYPGTLSFSREERSIFFGRDEDIANLFTSVVVNPTTLLFGKSGTGKSSIIQAGLIPKLQKRKSQNDTDPEPYIVIDVMPKPDDQKDRLWTKIYNIIESHLKSTDDFLQLSASDNSSSLWYLLKQYQKKQLSEKKPQTILLIFDQAEELFTYPDSQIKRLVRELYPVIGQFIPEDFLQIIERETSIIDNGLLELLYAPLPVKFIFSIRSDKLHLITRLKKASPHILQNSYELLPLKRKDAFKAIDKPSQLDKHYKPGIEFQSEKFKVAESIKEYIFQELSKQVTDPESNFEEARIEPFSLQIICSHIERELLPQYAGTEIEISELDEPNTIINAYYTGCINNLQVDNRSLMDEEKRDVRILIEEKMLSTNRRIPIHRNTIMQYTDCKVEQKILEILVEARILKKDYDSYGDSIYEITHDCLIAPIQKAMKERLGEKKDDESMKTINGLLKEIREKEYDKTPGDAREKRSAGFKGSGEEKSVGKTNVTAFINEDPKLIELYKKLGDAYIVIRDYNKAIDCFNKVIESPAALTSNSFFIEIYRARADAYYYLGKYEQSSNDLKKILEQNPDDYTAIIYLVENYDKENKLEEALKYFNSQLKITPQNTGLYTEIGNKYFARKEYEKARHCYQKTLDINPGAEFAIRNIGLIEESLGNTKEALKYYKQSLSINPDSAAIYNDIGNLYYAMKKFKEAKEHYLIATKKDESYNYAYYNLGLIEENEKNYEDAIRFYQKAIVASPGYEAAYTNMARIYFDRKEFTKAKEAYIRLVELDPSNENIYYDLGIIEEAIGDVESAARQYKKAIALSPGFEDAYVRLSAIYYDKEDYQQAKEFYSNLIKINPNNEVYYYGSGFIEEGLENWSAALDYYNKALELKPDYEDALAGQASVYFSQKKYKDAGEVYQKLKSDYPNNEKYLNNVAMIEEKLNHPDLAIEYYKKALQINADYEIALVGLSGVYFEQNDFQNAKETYLKLNKLAPKNEDYLYDLGRIEENLKNADAAITWYTKVIELKPTDEEAYHRLGTLKHGQGKIQEAIPNFEKVIELNPDNDEAINELGICYCDLEDWKRSEEYFSRAKEKDPGNYLYYNNIGLAKSELGLYKESEKLYKKSIELNPENPDAFYNYGELLEKMNKPKEAVIKYKKCLELSPDDNEVKERIAALEKMQSPAS